MTSHDNSPLGGRKVTSDSTQPAKKGVPLYMPCLHIWRPVTHYTQSNKAMAPILNVIHWCVGVCVCTFTELSLTNKITIELVPNE